MVYYYGELMYGRQNLTFSHEVYTDKSARLQHLVYALRINEIKAYLIL